MQIWSRDYDLSDFQTEGLVSILILAFIAVWWRVGRVVDCTGLENQRTRKGPVGSNPTLSLHIAGLYPLP